MPGRVFAKGLTEIYATEKQVRTDGELRVAGVVPRVAIPLNRTPGLTTQDMAQRCDEQTN